MSTPMWGNTNSTLAIDGDATPDPNACHCCSVSVASHPWWTIDLHQMYPIRRLIFVGRSGGKYLEQSFNPFSMFDLFIIFNLNFYFRLLKFISIALDIYISQIINLKKQFIHLHNVCYIIALIKSLNVAILIILRHIFYFMEYGNSITA